MRLTSSVRAARALVTRSPFPFSITFIVTDRCNFRCTYCNIPLDPEPEMTTAELQGAIDELAAAGMARASFSGGEALLRPDTPALVAHAKSRGLFTSLNTNGWLVEDHFEALAPALDMLVVSLDGTEAEHDAACARPGSYTRVIRVLDRAQRAGLTTATITVLGPWNRHCLPHVLDVCGRYGAWAYVQPAQSDCYDGAAGIHPSLGAAELHAIATDLERASAAGLPVAASGGYLRRLRRGPHFSNCATCAAGRYFATVLPSGRMVPCHLTSGQGPWPSGRENGFASAFFSLPRPAAGPGCAISPYQESDLIFSLDPRAILTAARRTRRPRPTAR